MPSRNARHVSWICADGWYEARRSTTRAAVTRALSVGHRQVHERALRAEARARQLLGGDGHGGRQVEHVDGPAAPHLAVDQLAPEGVVAPPVGVRRDDVGVA